MKKFIIIAVLLLQGFAAHARQEYSFRKYYVSSEGNDSSNGLTPFSAWKTLDKVNSAETDGFTVRGNVFSHTGNCCIRLFGAWYPSISMHGNTWDIPDGTLCVYHGHLDRIHRDSHKAIQAEAIEKPRVLKGKKARAKMKAIFNFD